MPFTVTPTAGGLRRFRHDPAGLVREESADGLTWSREVLAWDEGPLRPLCAAGPPGGLIALDANGRLLHIETAEGRPRRRAEVPLPETAERWYEAPPSPADVAIVRDAEEGTYRLFFCARRAAGRDPQRRGCIGSAVSEELCGWEVEPPIFAPNRYPELHSPHLFSREGRTALLYVSRSEHGGEAIRCAVAPRLTGPFESPEPDLLAGDVRTGVATVEFGPRRLAFFSRAEAGGGRASISRPGQVDFRADGRPYVRFFEGLLNLLGKPLFHTDASLESSDLLVRVLPRYGKAFRLTARVTSLNASAVGLLFRTTMTGHDNTTLWLDYRSNAVVARRGVNGRLLVRAARPLAAGEAYRLSIWAEGSFADVYLDDEWVLTTETEGRLNGGFGLAVVGGAARFEDVDAQSIEPA
jgi:hypothetical protein